VYWMFKTGPIGAPANRALSQWIDDEGMENPLSQVTNWEELDRSTMTQQAHDAFQATIGKFFLKRTKKEIAEEGLKRGINAVIASDPADVLSNPQLGARHFWKELQHHDLGITLNYPRHFFLCSETENYVRRSAPHIGQDNDDIYGKELGISSTEFAALRRANVI
jgi:crotonobetainyl-CoA:carnitine CoA-transferase CaiB-like acyl-CoA transferase